MILRTTSKLVCYSGRTGKSYAVAALAASANRSQNEGAKDNGSDGVSPKIKAKKISKAQRRAMVEAFVHNYKAMNDGKLPTTSNVKKQVGGSYYVVKKILQELELTESSVKNANQNVSGKQIVNDDGRFSNAKEVLTSRILVNAGIQNDSQMVVTNHAEIHDAGEKHTDAERCLQDSSSAKNVSSKAVATVDCYSESSAEQSGLLKRSAKTVFHSIQDEDNASDTHEMPSSLLGEDLESVSPCHANSENVRQKKGWTNGDIPVFVTEESKLHIVTQGVTRPGLLEVEDNKQKKAVSEERHGKDGSKDKAEHHEGIPERKLERDTSPRQINEAERPKESTLWGTLKAFADGIISIWRKG